MDNFLNTSGLCIAVVEIAGLGHHVDEFTNSREDSYHYEGKPWNPQ